MIRLDDIIANAQKTNKAVDIGLIRKAYIFSAKVHKDQLRLSGEPYLVHPLEVAYILSTLKADAVTIAAGLLHDTVEDTLTSLEEIREMFGGEVVELVDGVTKLSKLSYASKQQSQLESIRKLVLAMAKDIRVVLIKLADRTHNMRTLGFLVEDRQKITAQETLDIYSPLASRLGIYWIKAELEDLSLRFLRTDAYYNIAMQVGKKKAEREQYISDVCNILEEEFRKHGILCGVLGRPKHFYSIYNKMQTRNVSFDQIYDAFAFRAIVPTIKDCYAAVGIIHSMWKPIPGRFKDYIAFPKVNNYQSIHTTVFGPKKDRVEIQIRTEQMNHVAEDGIAAHWQYKESTDSIHEEDHKQFVWLRQTLENYQDLKDPADFLENLKMDLFPEEVYVFTPNGDIKELPKGACPIDLAFSVHTEIGMHCVGAKVDGRLTPLSSRLHNGDVVWILTSSKAKPSRDWLKYVKTSKAKSRIKAWLNQQQLARSAAIGRDNLEKEMKKVGLPLAALSRTDTSSVLLQTFKVKEIDTLFAQVSTGNISSRQVIEKIAEVKGINISLPKEDHKKIEPHIVRRKPKKEVYPVKVNGIDDVLVRIGNCCSPVVGDSIIGFITRGRGLTIHKKDCPRVRGIDSSRCVDVEWGQTTALRAQVEIQVMSYDKQGLLSDISRTISQAKVNIFKAQSYTTPEKIAVQYFMLDVENIEQLNRLIHALRQVKGVVNVERVKKAGALVNLR